MIVKLKKIEKELPNIIFGIFCGGGLFLISVASTELINRIIPSLDSYALLLFIFLYLTLLVSTSKLASNKGWFKKTYIITSVLILIRSVLIIKEWIGVIG